MLQNQKKSNIFASGATESREEREQGREILNYVIAENVSNLVKKFTHRMKEVSKLQIG